jgi:threonine dehydratase
MVKSLEAGQVVEMDEHISRFCDGSAVRTVGRVAYQAVKQNVDKVITVADGKVSTTILNLYEQGIAVEPSGVT